MFFVRNCYRFVLLHVVLCTPQINIDLTDPVSNNEKSLVFQHDCLHVAATNKREIDPYQIISYCLTELPSTWNIQPNTRDQRFTFAQLYQQNIIGEQLYRWSAPLDVIERYQLYLDQHSSADVSSQTGSEWFYNCSAPRFGPSCKYSLDIDGSDHGTLHEMIFDFYQHPYEPTTLTCYTYLECNRGSSMACLDWSEICDGYVDCQDGVDEASCWQLQFNVCEEDQYLCANGQCISKIFVRDDLDTYECLDRSDESLRQESTDIGFFVDFVNEPTFAYEDIFCPLRYTVTMKFTSSCVSARSSILRDLLLLDQPGSVTSNCWLAVKCALLGVRQVDPQCRALCANKTCQKLTTEICSDMWNVPAGTVAFGHMFFLYMREDMNNTNSAPTAPRYVCYNDQLCDGLYSNRSLMSFNNATCRRPEDFPLQFQSFAVTRGSWHNMFITPLYRQLSRCNKILSNASASCNNLTMYRCLNSSKCIPKQRVCDGTDDCDYKDDEACAPINNSCAIHGLEDLFQCTTIDKCISWALVEDNQCDCAVNEYGLCDDEEKTLHYIRKHISFPTICDGFTELFPVLIDEQNQTDETECQYWSCNNTYTRCDGFWNCFDGADEVDCNLSSTQVTCPHHHHICVSPDTSEFMCLPLEKVNNKIIDCLGGTDEPTLCRSNNYAPSDHNFYCITNENEVCTSQALLCYYRSCKDETDDQVCCKNRTSTLLSGICSDDYKDNRSSIENFFCARQTDINKPMIVNFALEKLTKPVEEGIEQGTKAGILHSSLKQTTVRQYQQLCHRGLVLHVWFSNANNSTMLKCLCPPSFYGDRCQYQNQRVSLTLRFNVLPSFARTFFVIIVSLIDDSDERLIHSYHQLTYVNSRDCQRKFNIYLLYSTRPKDPNKNYSIHIDVYDKVSFTYYGSFLLPIKFVFIPVHRLAAELTLIRRGNIKGSCSDQLCIHGQCLKYSDTSNDTTFCQCEQGWSGRICTIPYTITCSSDSLSVGVLASNRSVCICPLHKWGSRCLLQSTACRSDQNTTCHNRGECVRNDQSDISNEPFLCICRKGFYGKRCETIDNKFILSFHKDIALPEQILVHFIRAIANGPPETGSTFKVIITEQPSITVSWPYPFHVAFLDLFHQNYYLITTQKTHNSASVIPRQITPSDRCRHTDELLNETIAKLHLLRRIKYYHVLCQNHSLPLSCFYDEVHVCLCHEFGDHRLANCFEFNHTIRYDCFGQSTCENDAQCLQDRATCPRMSICVCPKCFYGIQCQFSSSLFDLSLDAILGYHIQPHMRLSYQSSFVKVSIALTMLIVIFGLLNGFLSTITFKNQEARKTGCGLYLLTSSINGLLVMIIFSLKFFILLIAQMWSVTNQTFLYSQCLSIDFLLRVGLSMDQWLSACVSIERAMTTIQRTHFDQKKSKQIAKYIIVALLVMTISTILHDPLHRRLLTENDDHVSEKRIWCIVNYTSALRTFNSFVLMFHFFAPFFINILTALIIIVRTARQRTTTQTNQTYKELLRQQFKQLNHLLIAPLVFISLAIPRLIISFTSGCMKSGGITWLFLIGYLISFIPPLFTFLVFVYPSKSYQQVFRKTMQEYRARLQRQLHGNS